MKAHEFRITIVAGLVIALLLAVTFDVNAQVTRQESTKQLKKAVYTFNPATCQQYIKKERVAGTCNAITNIYLYNLCMYYAFIAIPEITLHNLPSIQVWRLAPGSDEWMPMPTEMMSVLGEWNTPTLGSSFYAFTDGMLAVVWKTEVQPPGFPQSWPMTHYCPDLQLTNVLAVSNMIVLIYETPTISPAFALGASTSPSGVSLTLPTTAGRTYLVEHTPVLLSTSVWRILVSNIAGTGGPVSVTDSNIARQRFYRALEQ